MTGLVKPVARRGQSSSSRNIVSCIDKSSNSFIGDHDEEKYHRRRNGSTRDTTKKLFAFGVLLAVVFFTTRSSSSTFSSSYKTNSVRGDNSNQICNRKLPKVSNNKPSLSLLENPTNTRQCILLKKPTPEESSTMTGDNSLFSYGTHLSSFFHSFDLAHHHSCPLYITEDSWVWDILFPLFFGPSGEVEKNAKLWKLLEEILGVTIVENEYVASKLAGIDFDTLYHPPNALFYYHSEKLNPKEIRDHRDEVFRRLFRHPSTMGGSKENVCSAIDVLQASGDKEYTVIHLSTSEVKKYMLQLNESTGKDHSASLEMGPDYVHSLLKPTGYLSHDIYTISGSGLDEIKPLFIDDKNAPVPNLEAIKSSLGANIYLAVLADAYLGNPVDPMSLWITRMRYALGMKNTFVFTEKVGDEWVSYLEEAEDGSPMYLYNFEKLGAWVG